MVPRRVHAHLSKLFVLLSLISLHIVAMFSLLVFGAGSASAAPEAAPTLAVSPTNLTTCRQCIVTLINQSSNRNLRWFASSHGIPGVTITPSGGFLQPQGQASVNITVPSNISCPASDTITFTGPMNSVNVSWSCAATPTPSPTPPPTPPTTPTSIPTTAPVPSPTLAASPTQTNTSLTPTATSVTGSGGQRNDSTSPGDGSQQGSSLPSILLSVAALLLALLACGLYLISPAKASLRSRLLSLILPVSLLRKLDQNR